MLEIAKVLSLTPATVKYWMDRHQLNRRSGSDSAYVKQNPEGDPFAIKGSLTNRDRELFICALMLYWAEGSRKNKHVIQIANLDRRMLLLFTRFLKTICGVREEKICLTVQLFRKFDVSKTKNYWSRELGITKRFIKVNIHTDIRSKPNQQWSQYGIARIEVRNVKLKQWLDSALEKYLTKWL